MTVPRARRLAAIFLITGFFPPYLLQAEKKTLKRFDDPVVMESSKFNALFGSSLDRLALMALREGKWSPIPFQIDEKNPDDSYCFTMGPEASKDPESGLDANDEIIFMAKDAGDSAEGAAWPNGAKVGAEIRITDPKNGQKGWVYLFRFKGGAPRSPDDYIRVEIDEANRYRQVVTYEFVMGGLTDRIYPDKIAARKLPNGEPGKDVLDRLKMRGEAHLPLGIVIPFAFDDITRSEDKGWIDGPVRVLHYAEGYLEVGKYIKIRGQGNSLISYYVNHMIWPMTIEFPGSGGLVHIKNFRGYMDFNPNVYGSCSFSAANPYNKDVIFDGHMTEAEKNLDKVTDIDWISGYGPQGALVSRLFLDPRPPGHKQFPYYLDEETVIDEPEDHPGSSSVGYLFSSQTWDPDLPPATAYQYYYYLNELKPEDVYRILDILDHPLELEVKELRP